MRSTFGCYLGTSPGDNFRNPSRTFSRIASGNPWMFLQKFYLKFLQKMLKVLLKQFLQRMLQELLHFVQFLGVLKKSLEEHLKESQEIFLTKRRSNFKQHIFRNFHNNISRNVQRDPQKDIRRNRWRIFKRCFRGISEKSNQELLKESLKFLWSGFLRKFVEEAIHARYPKIIVEEISGERTRGISDENHGKILIKKFPLEKKYAYKNKKLAHQISIIFYSSRESCRISSRFSPGMPFSIPHGKYCSKASSSQASLPDFFQQFLYNSFRDCSRNSFRYFFLICFQRYSFIDFSRNSSKNCLKMSSMIPRINPCEILAGIYSQISSWFLKRFLSKF